MADIDLSGLDISGLQLEPDPQIDLSGFTLPEQPEELTEKLEPDYLLRLFNKVEQPTEEDFKKALKDSLPGQITHINKNNQGTLLMMVASEKDWPEAMADLLDRRECELNAQDNNGFTALHWAARNNRPETVRVLLEHNADRTIEEKRGFNAADLAKHHDYPTLAVYIACACRGLRAVPGARGGRAHACSLSHSSPLPLQVSASRMRSRSSTRTGARPSTRRRSSPSSRARAAATR